MVAGSPPGGPIRTGVGPGGQHPGRELLVILDGASEPLRETRESSLERADTPTLDALARTGTLTRARTIPAGLPVGSETAIPTLLGWTPTATVDRGAVEAAARGIDVPEGARAWRIDVRCSVGGRASAPAVARALQALRVGAPDHTVHALGGHRLLLVGPGPLPVISGARGLRVWPEGLVPPRTLDEDTVVIAAAGAAAGVARLLGARVVVPAGTTGLPDTDLRAKVAAARAGLRGGYVRIVVHVGGADEAAHRHDAEAKVAFLERADRELVAPLADAVRAGGRVLRVLPDHGCDPSTGAHDDFPVPCLTWRPDGVAARDARRFTERAVAELPVSDLTRDRVPA